MLIEIVQHLDDGFGGGAGGDDFETIFPGVARPGDKQRVLTVFNETASVSLHFCQMRPPGRHSFHCGWTLHRNHGRAHGVVRNVSPVFVVGPQVVHHRLAVGAVAHDQEVFRPHPVHDEVIDGASVFLASQSVPRLPILHARYFSGHDAFQKAFGGRASDGEPSHVADIKNRS